MKYITGAFVFLVFDADWQWWAVMCAWMAMDIFMIINKFSNEYKKQLKELKEPSKPMTKEQLEEVWNNGYSVGFEHSQLKKH